MWNYDKIKFIEILVVDNIVVIVESCKRYAYVCMEFNFKTIKCRFSQKKISIQNLLYDFGTFNHLY